MNLKHPIVILEIEKESNYRAFYADLTRLEYIAEDDESEIYPETDLSEKMEDVIRMRREH